MGTYSILRRYVLEHERPIILAEAHEETAGRTHNCAVVVKGVSGSNGTALGVSNRGHCTGGGS
jgi:hypothetical protein